MRAVDVLVPLADERVTGLKFYLVVEVLVAVEVRMKFVSLSCMASVLNNGLKRIKMHT